MVDLFEASIIKYIKDRFFKKFGIDVTFKYSPEMNFIEEFRKDRFSKIMLRDRQDFLEDLIGKYVNDINIAIWNRTPIRKMKNEENGIPSFKTNPQDKLVITTEKGIELRDVFYGKCDFNFKLFSSEAKILNMVEILYNTNFFDVNPPIKVTYLIDGEKLIIDYQTFFNEISSIDFIDTNSYGSMRLIEFDFSVYGLFFSPFYYIENLDIIEEIDLRVFGFEKQEDIDEIRGYTLNNYNKNKLICSETCQVDKSHLINEDTCKSLNQK